MADWVLQLRNVQKWRVVVAGIIFLVARFANSQTTAPSTQPSILRIWPGDPPATQPYDKPDTGETVARDRNNPVRLNVGRVTVPWLLTFLPPSADQEHAAVIICPGGGYTHEEMGNEGIEVAKRFAANNIAAFVLKYRLPKKGGLVKGDLPLPEQDVLRAMQYLRAHAQDFHLDPNRIGVVGFSAGGHVAAMAATLYDDAKNLKVAANDTVAMQSARPAFAILLYAVISMNEDRFKSRTAPALLGKDPDAELVDHFSVQEHVTAQTPPLFIFVARDDKTISYHQSEMMADAANRAGVPHEFTMIEHGGHGFGLGRSPESKTWFAKCMQWLADNHLN